MRSWADSRPVSGPTITRTPVRWRYRGRPGASRPRHGLARLRVLVDLLVDPTPIRCRRVRVAFSYPAFARIRARGGAVWICLEGEPPLVTASTTPPEGWSGGPPVEQLDDVALHVDDAVAGLLEQALVAVRWTPRPIGRLVASWYEHDEGLPWPDVSLP